MLRTGAALVLLSFALLAQDPAAEPSPFRLAHVSSIPWRNIGPANMGGRITDIEVPRGQPTVYYVATASGGLWKSDNAGTTWQALFQHEPTVSLGDVAVAPSNPDIVWVGTGEENARNSVSWGDGVYRSADGGRTWKHMGLSRTFQIGHIAIDPRDPDRVFVAALGRLWGHNPERGVYRTLDGGATWSRVLYLDDKTGCIDVRVDPQKPSVVYAAMYERLRDQFDGNDPVVRFGDGSGLYRSDDGGDTWKKLYRGLPTCKWGRTGLTIWDKNPATLFATIETERSGWATGSSKDAAATERVTAGALGLEGEDTEGGARLTSVRAGGAAAAAGLAQGDVVVQWGEEGVDGWRALRQRLRDGSPGDVVPIVVSRDDEQLELEITLAAEAPQRRGNAYMGITGEDGDDGALLTMVTSGGPSEKAGLRGGDLIVQMGETAISSYNEMLSVLRRASAGDVVTVTVVRGDERVPIELTYGTRPGSGGGPGGPGGSPNGPFGGRLGGQRANVQDEQGDDGYETGGIFRSDDRGETWRRINSVNDRPFYFSVIAVDPSDDKNIYTCGITFYASHDGGESFDNAGRGTHPDYHAIWVNPDNGRHLLLGCDGGINVSYDRCDTWEVLTNFDIGQFYHADVDQSVPYRVYGGLQDNGTWGGPSRTRAAEGITSDDWVQVFGGDGFTARVDPTDPGVVYATSQLGNLGRVDMRTGAQARVQRPRGDYSFNWDTPFFLSPHNPRVLYFGGNHAFRSLDQGRRSEQITKQPLGLTDRGTATAMAESPRLPGLLYVGTDDGALWRSPDGGHTWEEIHKNVLGMPGPRYVSSIHPSSADTDRVYVTFDGHRSDDFATHVYVSEDRGDTWSSLIGDLPDEPCHVCREDPTNADLLFLGTEFSCYVSLDRGRHWMTLGRGLPTVAVRDLAIQDRDSDLVAATHGRGIWILDLEPLRQLTAEVASAGAHLFEPEPAILWQMQRLGLMGDKQWLAPNPPYGATVYVLLAEPPEEAPEITIHDVTGERIAAARGEARAGLQRIVWNARAAGDGERAARGPGRRGRRGPPAPPGAYSVRLEHAGETLIQPLTLLPDPGAASSSSPSAPTSRN